VFLLLRSTAYGELIDDYNRIARKIKEMRVMSNRKKYYLVLTLTWTITLLPSMYYAYMQMRENKIVDQYLSSNNLIGLPVSKETAVRVSNQVRNDFNVNNSSFVALNVSERPFLREDVAFLLTHKEGLCGEGARVVVNLLNKLDFDATRVILFNKYLQSAHTLVSVLIDEHEFFVDGLTTSHEVNKFLINSNISSNDFILLHYSDNVDKRREFDRRKEFVLSNQTNKSEEYINFFNHYWLYSYEATPYTKLLTKIGIDVRVFNFNRPSHWLSVMAEEPNLVMFFVTFIASVFAMFLLHKLRIINTILRMKIEEKIKK
jgi:hypothetical protein